MQTDNSLVLIGFYCMLHGARNATLSKGRYVEFFFYVKHGYDCLENFPCTRDLRRHILTYRGSTCVKFSVFKQLNSQVPNLFDLERLFFLPHIRRSRCLRTAAAGAFFFNRFDILIYFFKFLLTCRKKKKNYIAMALHLFSLMTQPQQRRNWILCFGSGSSPAVCKSKYEKNFPPSSQPKVATPSAPIVGVRSWMTYDGEAKDREKDEQEKKHHHR